MDETRARELLAAQYPHEAEINIRQEIMNATYTLVGLKPAIRAIQSAASMEREAIVAWLRKLELPYAGTYAFIDERYDKGMTDATSGIATAIENGVYRDHLPPDARQVMEGER